MALSADDAARLARLQAAYDKLIAGANVVRVMVQGGRLTEFGPGQIDALKREIDQLNAQATTTRPVRTRGAIGFRINF